MAMLRVRLVGPKVRQGKISVDDLTLVARALQTSLERFAERTLEGTPSLRKGPRSLSQKALVNLFITGIDRGSTVLVFEPGPGQMDLNGHRVGMEVFSEWIAGAKSLQDPNHPPPDSFDRGVLSAIHQLHPILGRGVDRVEMEWGEGRATTKAIFDARSASRTESLLMRPTQNRGSISGVILQADFHSPDVVFTVYTTDGRSVRCTASEDDLGVVLSGLMHMVRVTGETRVDPATNAVLSVRADGVELEGEGELPGFSVGAVHDFWSSPDLSTLESRQGIPEFDPTEKAEGERPTDDEWERYERAITTRRRHSAGLP